MKLNLFRKFYFVSSLAITIALSLLVIVYTFLEIDYIKKDRLTLLENNVISISEAVKNAEEEGEYFSVLERTGKAISSDEYTVFFVTLDGRTFLCTDNSLGNYCLHEKKLISKDIMKYIFEYDIYSELGTLSDIYYEDHFVAGAQLLDKDGNIIGAVFVSLNADMYVSLINKSIAALLISVVFALLVLYIVILILTKKILKPLTDMSAAAKSMANGDFTTKINYQSDDEIGELANSFNTMSNAMLTLENVRSSFISNVSHEFKTPMTVIAGYIDGIIDGTISKENQDKYLKIISNEVKRLNVMVNSMLHLSKIESGELMNYVKTDLSEIVLNVFLNLEPKITEKNIDVYGLDSLGTMIIECDNDLMFNAICNLVDNAVKFSPVGGYISVSKVENFDTVSFFIKNNGDGIEEEEIVHIFERFYKTDKSRSVDKLGTGLGLHIVKNIILCHKGEIFARSKVGAYTEFEIILPKKIS